MHTPCGDVDHIALLIRKHFADAKKEQAGGKPWNPSQKFRNPEFWHVAAGVCIDIGADPYSFVRAAFRANSVLGGPFPNQLCGNAIRKWFKDYQASVGAANGENTYEKEIACRIRDTYITARDIGAANQRTMKTVLLTDMWMRLDEAPAFVRMLLFPTDPDIYAKWAHIAYTEILGTPKLYSYLQEKNYDLSFLAKREQDMRSF